MTDPRQINEAKAFSPLCWQRPAKEYQTTTRSEDCLFLNVWAPQWKVDEITSGATPSDPLPVLVWVHGGGFVVGAGNNHVISGLSLARENVILVSFNYRLGLFGFWKHESLKATGENITSNFGLHDQVMALEWIQKNIASFGGDSRSVTVLGESAGGTSILHHLTSRRMLEDAREGRPKLFHRAWIISAVLLETPFIESPENEIIGEEWANTQGCSGKDVLQCMRSLEPAKLISPLNRWSAFDYQANRATIYTSADADFPLIPVALREGNFVRDIPLVMGSSRDDGSLFAWFSFPLYGPDKDYLDHVIERTFGDLAPELLKLYPSEAYTSEYWRLTAMLSDAVWHCPAATVNSAFAALNLPSRRYVLNFRFNDSSDLFGIFHCGDLALVFENPSGNYLFPRYFTPEELELSKRFTHLLLRFMKDDLSDQDWPTYTTQQQNYLLVGHGTVNSTEFTFPKSFHKETCRFWHNELPRGLRSFPVNIYEQEGWKSSIANTFFWYMGAYEEYLTHENGIIALIATLAIATLLWKLVAKLFRSSAPLKKAV